MLTVIKRVFGRDEEFKGRDIAFVSDWLTKKVFTRAFLKTGRADDDCSLVGYFNTILARGGGNLNDPIFKSSNARALPGGGRGGGC